MTYQFFLPYVRDSNALDPLQTRGLHVFARVSRKNGNQHLRKRVLCYYASYWEMLVS